ncbi:MAG: SIS domain-containing protein [Planctomycetes bacterium]|nr:SIS domain-containing protein [Planctomycetota bacterium]
MSPSTDELRASLTEAAVALAAFSEDEAAVSATAEFSSLALEALRGGKKLLACGNGGSMCDAMHFAEEWTGRFRGDRAALPALAFSDPAQLTCIANDFGFAEVFARQIAAHGREGDVLVALSTSGESPNILRALEEARARGIKTVGLLGRGGGAARELADVAIVVPAAATSDRIQEVHIKVLHAVIEAVERQLFPETGSE